MNENKKWKWKVRYYAIRIILLILGFAIAGGSAGIVTTYQVGDKILPYTSTIQSQLESHEHQPDSLAIALKTEVDSLRIELFTAQENLIELIGEYDKLAKEYYRHLEIYHSLYQEELE